MRACTDTSSADTGSSATSTFGFTASARAKLARWHWPPESSRGYWSSTALERPTMSIRDNNRGLWRPRPPPKVVSSSSWRPRTPEEAFFPSASPSACRMVMRGLREPTAS